MNSDLWSRLEPKLRQAHGKALPRQNGSGWIGPIRSPLREDRSPSFSVRPDNGDAGAWKDHATGESGSLRDLARQLGVDVPTNRPSVDPLVAFAEWAAQRKLDGELLRRHWRLEPVVWSGRPACRFPTALGVDRIRFLDSGQPKTMWAKKGGRGHWYGLEDALALRGDGPIYVVNGEPSVWACYQSAVPAICTCSGEGTLPSTDVLAELGALGRPIRVVYDRDDAGRKGARKLVRTLRDHCPDVEALELPDTLPDGGDVDDLHRQTGDEGLAEALAALPEMKVPKRRPTGTRRQRPVNEDLGESDLANSVRLARGHGRDLRFCGPIGTWLAWTGSHWAMDDTGEVMRRAKDTARAIAGEAEGMQDDAAFKARLRWARTSCSRSKLEAMVALARSEPGIPVRTSELDRDPWLLNVANGTLDLRTGELRGHRRKDMITLLVPTPYDPSAPRDLWLAFLDRIFRGERALLDFVQRALGWSLTGDASEQVLLFCYGTGSNGKSTMLGVLQDLLGPYAKQAPPDLLMTSKHERHPTELADLRGARLVVATEVAKGRWFNEVKLKVLTGGDRIKARYMNQDFFEFAPSHSLWLIGNHKPNVNGLDDAFRRRIRLVPFEVEIPPDELDPQLKDKLVAQGAGVLAWMVEGALRWRKHGLGSCDAITAATQGYFEELDRLAGWMEDCCERDLAARTPIGALRDSYERWCQQNSEEPVGSRAFGDMLAERGHPAARGSKGVRVRRGLRLRTPAASVTSATP